MSSVQTVAQKAKELIDRTSGCRYEIRWDHGRPDWGLRHLPLTNEFQVGDLCYACPDVSARYGFIEIERGSPDMRHVLDGSYYVWMLCEDLDKLLDPNVRKRLEKIIPAIAKDYEIVCDGMEEIAKKYGLPQSELILKSSNCYIHFGAKLDAKNMSDEEILKAIEPKFRAIGEVGCKFDSWLGPRVLGKGGYSQERQALIDKGVHVPSLPGRLRNRGFLVIDWPPNTGDSKKDEEVRAEVKKWLENKMGIVFTPEGRLKLVNGEIVLVRPKRGSKPGGQIPRGIRAGNRRRE